ncbi:Elongation factor 1-beta [Microtus ochrogaster]|uniref:Elongation factor 1-beta n=1 Tax=Microtus ochrogaster TaxID=79684 RepID=A0A8J6KQI3_MICOH|nr:Elongation factor 1-beta [Microtus ochrogaster]
MAVPADSVTGAGGRKARRDEKPRLDNFPSLALFGNFRQPEREPRGSGERRPRAPGALSLRRCGPPVTADAMGFGDLRTPAGLQVLNDYLADKSYIEGYVPSQADVAVFEAVSGPPPADLFHALRWYNHIKSYEKEKASKGNAFLTLFPEPAVVAKSSILLDVKPWDDETDMAKLEECVRSIQADGLVWGSSKLVPVGYGIKKLQIQCVVEDDKVGTDMLEEQITAFEDYVQSMDVAAFNKI